jgi:hypothetical protein
MSLPLTFTEVVAAVLDEFQPARFPFFAKLAHAESTIVTAPAFLDELYKRYQAAMHSTRVMIYHVPFMDEIDLRVRKCAIIADDDCHGMADSHHSQLRRTWTYMLGRAPSTPDCFFGELTSLAAALDPGTAQFVLYVESSYRKSLGPCCVVEGLAHGWIGALADALCHHFPGVRETPYFVENLASNVELRHAAEAIDLVSMVIERRPSIETETIAEVRLAAMELRRFWEHCGELL